MQNQYKNEEKNKCPSTSRTFHPQEIESTYLSSWLAWTMADLSAIGHPDMLCINRKQKNYHNYETFISYQKTKEKLASTEHQLANWQLSIKIPYLTNQGSI